MTAYYNEIDKNAAAWLRELIKAGLIADGEVDERSISDVDASELARFTQVHCFAGIGVWSYALRQAGWPDDRQVWTGSCPCQPFSIAGKGRGFSDERHLWPEFFRLISQCRPDTVIGEQVASKDGLVWLDTVCADLERENYAVGAVDTCAAGYGAPHIRQRLYWMAAAHDRVADTISIGRRGRCPATDTERGREVPSREIQAEGHGALGGGMAHAATNGFQTYANRESERETNDDGKCGRVGGLAYADLPRSQGRAVLPTGETEEVVARSARLADRPGPTDGIWAAPDWVWCRDNKWRPVEPGVSPLAPRTPAHVVKLRGYGNAINAKQAQAFIEAVMEVLG